MSTQNINYSNLDGRYSKPTDVAAAISAQATTDAGQYVPKSNIDLNAMDFGAKGDGTTDDTVALQAFFNAVTVASCRGYIPAKNYKITDEIKIGVGTNGSANWHIIGTGAIITQATDNKATFRFWKELTRYFTIEGIQFQWTNQQPVTNTRASAILFDSDTNNNYGFYNFRMIGLSWGNGCRGISINEANTNTIPVWGARISGFSHLATMTGCAIKLVQTASGQPNTIIEQGYLRGDAFAETGYGLITLQGYNGLLMNAIEFNNTIGIELLLTTCNAVEIGVMRSEKGTLSANFTGLWTFSDVRASISSIEVYNHTFSAAAWAYIIRAISGNTMLSIGNARVGSLAIPTGQVALINADTAKSIEFTGGFQNDSGIPKYYAYDNTLSRIVRDGNMFYQGLNVGTNAQTLASAGAVTIPTATGALQRITLNANATSSTITAPATGAGYVLTIVWIQGASGNYTYVWPTACKFAAGVAPTASTTAGYKDSVTFWYDGTNWNEINRSIGVH